MRAARTLFIRTRLWNKGGEHRDGWQPNSLVAEQAHPQHGSVRVTATWQWSYVADQPQRGSGATVRESPEHGSGAVFRTTAVTEPEHARAPITEDWIKNITYLIAAKNVRVPVFLVVGSTDMHEEKNIDTVIQSIYRLRGTGQVELFRVVVQFISAVFRMHWFGLGRDWRETGSQDQR